MSPINTFVNGLLDFIMLEFVSHSKILIARHKPIIFTQWHNNFSLNREPQKIRYLYRRLFQQRRKRFEFKRIAKTRRHLKFSPTRIG